MKATNPKKIARRSSLPRLVRRLVRLWRKEARANLRAEWAYKNQKPISFNRAAFEKGLALAKQQCADQLAEAVKAKPPNSALSQGGPASNDNKQESKPPLAQANG